MEHLFIPAAALLAALLCCGLASAADWQFPVIKGAGEVVPLPEAAVQPDPSLRYQIVCDIMAWPQRQGAVVPGLAKVARIVNLYASAGVAPDQMDLVAVLRGPAIEAAIEPGRFQDKYGFANPNRDLLEQLNRAGVEIYVCGQGLADMGIAPQEVNPRITIALSALTVLPTYQLRGYALLSF